MTDTYGIEERIAIMVEDGGRSQEEAVFFVRQAWIEETETEPCGPCDYVCSTCEKLPMILREVK